MDVPNQITTTMTVETVGRLDDKRGTQLINLFIPEIGVQKWSTTMFVPIDVAANMNAGDVFTATLQRGKLKNNKTGEYANEYYWDYSDGYTPTVEEDEASPMTQPNKSTSTQSMAVPADIRQGQIMLQHASAWVAPAYADWNRLPNETRPTWSDYLITIVTTATWVRDTVYNNNGYYFDATANDPWDQAVDP